MSQRVVAITGGYGALGRAVVEAAQARGLSVAVIGRTPPRAPNPDVFEINGVDLIDPAQAKTAIESVVAHYGRLDALLNIAGGFVWSPIEGDDDAFDRMHALNLKTTLNASRAALPHLKASPEGRIVNIGANGAIKAGHGMGAYAASKAGVHRLTEALAEELKSTSVTVNAVLPSIIDTAANRADMPGADPAKWVAPADLAAVILFLASPEARAVRGALIPVTGKV
ncbi:MAG: SDR family NAD(P)-dependent oxidoreductase [Brevundimonas sp.]|jgi:NAD(P)-dependent dehydrogenase (short-subunit alcohol dehydrogenase family)|uniref:SDR family NAD(P)-dependent oxidoreductase n=1 Tax=Brevundimonas sp. TaxID=1871086 RepID=UPI0025C1AAB0|nr:SDR family NAD(P)-dependent oxidoreductase [Brevundimonas sp.]MCH4268160.1 SDR family NAD(P)-dependent oxidoreductase [Brevundimonas sp.]